MEFMSSTYQAIRHKDLFTAFCFALLVSSVFADAPPGYYSSAEGLRGENLRNALKTWITVLFNGINLSASQIAGFGNILLFDLTFSVLLTLGFSILVFGGSVIASDRVFTINAGQRTEQVTTVGRDNIVLRGVRRLFSGSFGSLLIVNMKDYFRKAQNLSKMFYGVVLAVVLPVMMTAFAQLRSTARATASQTLTAVQTQTVMVLQLTEEIADLFTVTMLTQLNTRELPK